MGNGDHRLDSIFLKLLKDAVVKCQPLLVWRLIIGVRKNPGPADGHPIGLKTHFRKQGNVFLVVMIMIDRLMGGIIILRIQVQRNASGLRVGTHGHHVGHADALPSLPVSALHLVGRRSAAPEEILSK